MRGVDLARFRFDFDLTFAAITLHPDGHIYHRYGGRDVRGAERWLSTASLQAVLEATLEEHAAYSPNPDPPTLPIPVLIEKVPAFAKRDKGECIHCHSINTSLHEQAVIDGRWNSRNLWVHPEPDRIGIDLERDAQTRISHVRVGSAAAIGGLLVGDRLLVAGELRVVSASDVMAALDAIPWEGGVLPLSIERAGEERAVSLTLGPGWKEGTPYSFSWRPSKWGLEPVPGFGGRALEAAELDAAGLAQQSFAFRIDYFVTWGDRRRFGQAAMRAGLLEGDVVVRVGESVGLRSVDHFHSWWRLTREVGERVRIVVLRQGERVEIELEVQR